MIPNPFPGSHFVCEGIDGCGKSEQMILITTWLRLRERATQKTRVVLTKEPNRDGFWGSRIYADLDRPGGLHETNMFGFQTWYAMDSRDNYRNVVLPALKAGKNVISDRSRPSMVFGARYRQDIPKFMAMNLAILGAHFIWPDAIFIFDVSVETAIRRLLEKHVKLDGHEQAPVLTRVRENYLYFAREYRNCHLINAERPVEEIFKDVQKIITAVLESKTKPV